MWFMRFSDKGRSDASLVSSARRLRLVVGQQEKKVNEPQYEVRALGEVVGLPDRVGQTVHGFSGRCINHRQNVSLNGLCASLFHFLLDKNNVLVYTSLLEKYKSVFISILSRDRTVKIDSSGFCVGLYCMDNLSPVTENVNGSESLAPTPSFSNVYIKFSGVRSYSHWVSCS